MRVSAGVVKTVGILIAFAIYGPAVASPFPQLAPGVFLDPSNIALVGRVVDSGHAQPGKIEDVRTLIRQSVTIEVAGLITPGVSLPTRVVVQSYGFSMFGRGEFGIFALKLGNGGGFINAAGVWMSPAKQVVKGRTLHPAKATAALVTEMLAILNTPRARMQDARTGVNMEVMMPADSFADRQYDQAVDVLDALPRDISEPILHSLEKTSDKGVRLWAASSLLQRSRLSVLKQIAPLLMTPNAETEDSAEYAASMFPNEGLPADLLPTLVMLLRSKAGFVRSAAASALASSPSLETRREIVRAILRETDKETLQGEASALCELQNDYRRCESFRGTIDESVTDSALREWATQQLAQPLPPDYRVNN